LFTTLTSTSQSATDFYEALLLDPDNKELPQMLQRSKDKYLEVEGRGEWQYNRNGNGNGSGKGSSVSAINGNAPQSASTGSDAQTESEERPVRSGTRIGIAISRTQDADGMNLPAFDTLDLVMSGPVRVVDSESSPVTKPSSSDFTRVQITFDDDNDEEEEEVEEEVQGANSTSGEAVSEFTRVQIVDEDEDEDEEVEEEKGKGVRGNAAVAVAASASSGSAGSKSEFTRVAISIVDDDDEDHVEEPSPRTEKEKEKEKEKDISLNYGRMNKAGLLSALAEIDLKLARDPLNGDLRNERTAVAKLARGETSMPPPVPVTGVASQAAVSNERHTSSEQSLPPIPKAVADGDAANAARGNVTAASTLKHRSEAGTEPRKPISSSRLPSVPSEAPKTLYEFERNWRGLKTHLNLFGQYLTLFNSKAAVKKVFKEALTPELLSSVFAALRDFCTPETVLRVLGGLSQTSHFPMTLALLMEEDLQCIKTIFTNLLRSNCGIDAATEESLKALRVQYNV
jgi:Potential Monad-binding region of RPAP3